MMMRIRDHILRTYSSVDRKYSSESFLCPGHTISSASCAPNFDFLFSLLNTKLQTHSFSKYLQLASEKSDFVGKVYIIIINRIFQEHILPPHPHYLRQYVQYYSPSFDNTYSPNPSILFLLFKV
ncbi:hypothetical protein EYC84_006362 [Monilinia fructicola]|uniref:Uncharacterized protein n=1 Tax=Monilinia fructicola TaxID=38448 RepID=A0A5M9K6W4_MONFR|nr:hypothetical protein EYC84_006362 [Monilinia fructicola]